MQPETVLTLGRITTAHPESSNPHVEVPTLVVVLAAVTVVVVLAAAVPTRPVPATGDPEALRTSSWWGSLTAPQWVVRAVALAMLVLCVVAGRVGVDDELENLAPALVIGAGLPLLVLGCLVLGSLWRWVDPWDTLARLASPGDTSSPASHVWPAVIIAVPWWWFLGAWPRPLDPRAVGLALAAYTVVTVAGCLVLGRARWLSSSEPLGLLLTWLGLVPRRRLSAWVPPAGAVALLGVSVGGLLFGVVRRTELWIPVATSPRATVWSTAGLVVACVVGGGTVTLASRWGESPGARAVVARALLPVVAGVLLAVALARNRFFNSVQLLPGLIGDPLGRGWDLLGSPTDGLDPAPLGAVGLVALQLGVVAIAHLAAAGTTVRTLVGDERLPVIVVLAASAAAGITALSLH